MGGKKLISTVSVLVSASECVVKVDHALDLLEFIRCDCELRLKEGLLRREHLEVVCKSMFHKELGVPHRGLQMYYLLLVDLQAFLCCLPLDERIVHFNSSIEEGLLELI